MEQKTKIIRNPLFVQDLIDKFTAGNYENDEEKLKFILKSVGLISENNQNFLSDFSKKELAENLQNLLTKPVGNNEISRNSYLLGKAEIKKKQDDRFLALEFKYLSTIKKFLEQKQILSRCQVVNEPKTFTFYLRCRFRDEDFDQSRWKEVQFEDDFFQEDSVEGMEDFDQDFEDFPEDFEDFPEDFEDFPEDFEDFPEDFEDFPEDFEDFPEESDPQIIELEAKSNKGPIVSVDESGIYSFYNNFYVNEGTSQDFKLVPLEIFDIRKELEKINFSLLNDVKTDETLKEIRIKQNLLFDGTEISDQQYLELTRKLLQNLSRSDIVETAREYDYLGGTLLSHYGTSELVSVILDNLQKKRKIPEFKFIKMYLERYESKNYKFPEKLSKFRMVYDITHADTCSLCELSDEFVVPDIEHTCGSMLCTSCVVNCVGKCPMCRQEITDLSESEQQLIKREEEKRNLEKKREQEQEDARLAQQLAQQFN